ncbi:hypothetical protein HanIR_Chr07g0318961 [Helianthus annuus]|nr:hypothetical protein HanIR_Chr07g0318961 [Helianthus annuus]
MPRRGFSVILKTLKGIFEFYRKSEFPEQLKKLKILYLLFKTSGNWNRVKRPCRTPVLAKKGIFGINRTVAITAGYEQGKIH